MNKTHWRILFIFTLILTIILLSYQCFIFKKRDAAPSTPEKISYEAIPLPSVTIQYGVIVDSLRQHTATVKKNQFLADLFKGFDFPYAYIDKMAKESASTFDVRKIKKGNPYHIFYSEDSIKKRPHYFVYELTKSQYITYDLTNSKNDIQFFYGEKSVETVPRFCSGEITGSLWAAIQIQGENPLLALKLSEIYAWTIDFFELRTGDQFIIHYDEIFVEGESVGIRDIHNILITHRNTPYYCFRYQNDSLGYEYYDEKGESLRRSFLKAPLQYSRISSHFSHRRYHPVLKIHRPHHGVDYAAPTGTPVMSVGDGEVVARGFQEKGGGNYLKVKHNATYTTTYMHLSRFAQGMKKGKRVKQGEVIGYVGSTGCASGPHLDFRVHKNGQPINPLTMVSTTVDPIPQEKLTEYQQHIEPHKKALDSISNCLNAKWANNINPEILER